MSMTTVKNKITEAWKAVVALAIPILFGAAASIVEGFGEWVSTQSGLWVGIALGLIEAVAVWLKRNAPAHE